MLNGDIYSMKLHESLVVDNSLVIIKVHGGWVYVIRDRDPNEPLSHASAAVFVPQRDKHELLL